MVDPDTPVAVHGVVDAGVGSDAGGVGSAIAPLFSSKVVEIQGTVGAALYACFALQVIHLPE